MVRTTEALLQLSKRDSVSAVGCRPKKQQPLRQIIRPFARSRDPEVHKEDADPHQLSKFSSEDTEDFPSAKDFLPIPLSGTVASLCHRDLEFQASKRSKGAWRKRRALLASQKGRRIDSRTLGPGTRKV